ncbi:MAG: hypothetical protein WBA41_08320 [Rivularia sp. (in: cyanobacteria)]
MDKEQIEQFITGLNKFHWHNDYRAFCATLEFNPEDKYSEDKWHQFLELIKTLQKFDNDSLVKMVNEGLSHEN